MKKEDPKPGFRDPVAGLRPIAHGPYTSGPVGPVSVVFDLIVDTTDSGAAMSHLWFNVDANDEHGSGRLSTGWIAGVVDSTADMDDLRVAIGAVMNCIISDSSVEVVFGGPVDYVFVSALVERVAGERVCGKFDARVESLLEDPLDRGAYACGGLL